jgi:hypothetical protein
MMHMVYWKRINQAALKTGDKAILALFHSPPKTSIITVE